MKTAFIDIGTNSVRYLAAEIGPGGAYSILARGLSAPRLGEGLAGAGRLKKGASARTLASLRRIEEGLAKLGVVSFRTVGTEGLRLAENRGDFLRRSAALGLEVEVISGEEEARLILRGALSGLPAAEEETLLADLGGGSTELVPSGPGRAVSLPLGAVRLKEEFSPGRDPGPVELDRMRRYCRDVLEKAVAGFPRPALLAGLGGTFTTLAAIILGLKVYAGDRIHGLEIRREEIEEIFFRLRGVSPARRLRVPGLERSRADIIIPGIVAARAILDCFSLGRVTVSDRGLLFGLLEEAAAAVREKGNSPR